MESMHPTRVEAALERRKRRIARRRQRILAAAAKVFANKGFAGATTKEIADEADMGESTLYNYFKSKRDLLLAIADEADTPLLAVLQAPRGETVREQIVGMFENALDITEAELPFIRTVITEAWLDDQILNSFLVTRLQQIHRALMGFIAENVATGRFRPVDPVLGAQLAIGVFSGLLIPALRGVVPLPSPEKRRALAESMADLLLHGVCARPEPAG